MKSEEGGIPDGIKIRRLQAADIDRVSRMEEECFSMPWSRKLYEQLLDRKECLYLVAEECRGDRREILGCCGLHQVLEEGEISNVMVTRSARGRGIGEGMMRELLRRGVERGISEFTLEVRISNDAAKGLYEKLGFVCEGIRPGFYEKPREDALIYWLRNGES